jgi:hypothetical protein
VQILHLSVMNDLAYRRARRTTVSVVALGLFATVAWAAPARFTIDDRNPEANLPSEVQRRANPNQFQLFLQELIDRARNATTRGDHLSAARYYSALAKAQPTRSAGYSLLCQSLEALGELEGAMDACADALSREGVTIDDFTRYIHLVLGKSGPLNATERARVETQISHLRHAQGGRLAAEQLQCELGLRVNDISMLEECTAGLNAIAAGDPKSIAYDWALAMQKRELGRAAQLIDRARLAGLAPQALRDMELATSAVSPSWRQLVTDVRLLLLAFLVGGALLLRRSLLSPRG